MAFVKENGVAYEIEEGRVVKAVKEAEQVAEPLKYNDRVIHGKKLGKVVSLVPSMYGQSVGVRFDDGSFGEYLPESLERAVEEKTAKLAGLPTNEAFKAEYDEYVEMPIDTLEEVESKIKVARTLNVRAKSLASNSQNALADNIIYDSVVTATAVDIMDLKDQQEKFRVADNQQYLEQLPQFETPEVVSPGFGMTRGGDASWLGSEELEPEPINEAWLAQQAATLVASLSKEQLEDRDLLRQALTYRYDNLPDEEAVRTKFASLVTAAKHAKLAASEPTPKTASVSEVDLDGNPIDLESLDIDAIFA